MKKFVLVALFFMTYSLFGECVHNWIKNEDGQTVCESCGKIFCTHYNKWENVEVKTFFYTDNIVRCSACGEVKEIHTEISSSSIALVLLCVMFIAIAAYLRKRSKKEKAAPAQPKEASMTVEQAREIEEKRAFQRKVERLQASIRNSIDSRKNGTDKELDEFYIKKYEELLDREIQDERQLADVVYLYNRGMLRTEDEIYVHSGKFEKACNRRSYTIPLLLFFIGWLPVVIGFMVAEGGFGFIPGAVLGVFPGGILSLIGGFLGEATNDVESNHLLDKGVHEAAPMAKRAKQNLKVTAAASAAAAAGVVHSTKKAAKDIANVDGWKQMK